MLVYRTVVTAIIAVGFSVAAAFSALAQSYPTRPVHLIVPYPPGGPTDVIARVMASSVSPVLGQPIIVENRLGGASGTVGGRYVATSEPDGYTLLISVIGSLTIAPSLYKLEYDPLKDFAPVAIVSQNPEILTVTPSLPAQSLAELLTYARSKPGQLNLASPGTGTLPHLLGELLQIVTDIKMTHVPYHGAAPGIIDLLSGRVQVMFNNPSVVLSHLEAGKLRAFGITGGSRASQLPDVPTFAELGYPKLTATEWLGLVAPANTPDAIVQKLNAAIATGLKDPAAVSALQKLGGEANAMTPAEFKTFMADETRRWADVVAKAGVKPE